MTELTLIQDLMTDANNRYEAINPNSSQNHGYDWKEQASPEDKPTVEKIFGKTQKEAFDILIPYLEEKYKNTEGLLSQRKKIAEDFLQKNKETLFSYIEKITRHPIAYDEIKLFITTYPRCPYNWERGYIWLNINVSPDKMLSIVAHEILHFQFHKYYSNHLKVRLLSPEQYYLLKESLTFLLNHEFNGLLKELDFGYPKHRSFRKQLEDYRLSQPEQERDFEKLIDYGCDLLSQQNVMQEKILGIITNEEFEDRILDVKNYRKSSVRGVILNAEKKIAIIYSAKENYYKLPGGGVEEGESNEVAMEREGKEETGADIKVDKYIGTVVEQNKNGDILQHNRGYLAGVVGALGATELTEVEQERKFELQRMDINKAIALMEKNSPISYRGKFMQSRDLQFLREARKIIAS